MAFLVWLGCVIGSIYAGNHGSPGVALALAIVAILATFGDDRR